MTFQTLRTSIDTRGIATLMLARPDKHNALNACMIGELTDAASRLGGDSSVRAVILRGDGASFCAGGGLAWMQEQFAAPRATRIAEARKLAYMLRALNEMPKPLIGAAHGSVFGGGVGLLSICDCAIAADTTKFGLTETRLGLIPATIGPYVAARLGEGSARRIFMSARIFGAGEARDLGLIAVAVPPSDLATAAEAEASAYLATAPGAVAAAKSLLRRLGPAIDDSVIEETIARLADSWDSAEAHEGVSAFLQKSRHGWSI